MFWFHITYLRFAEYFQVIDFTYIGIPKKSTYLRYIEKQKEKKIKKNGWIRKFISFLRNEIKKEIFTNETRV